MPGFAACAAGLFLLALPAGAEVPPIPVENPKNVQDLLEVQKTLQQVLPEAMKPVVLLKSSSSSGTGIVVSEDGVIYTAAHVVETDPDEKSDMKAVLPDGSSYEFSILKMDQINDAAIIKLKGDVKLEHVVPVASQEPVEGEWVFSLGHGNGYDGDRGAPVRLGRIVSIRSGYYKTDCKLIGGDSGGPLFNMKGELIGIHSRVGQDLEHNIHIPMPVFKSMGIEEGKKKEEETK